MPIKKPIDPDLIERARSTVVGIKSLIPADAMTAEVLGTERSGNGVIIRADGLVLTIGYLVTEAETVWITLADGRVLPGHVLGYDQATGFGLVSALARVELPAITLGSSAEAKVGDAVTLAGAGAASQVVTARIIAKQEFAGYWEYVLDEAIFTAPAHPNWGGSGLIDGMGRLIGIGSLQMQLTTSELKTGGAAKDANMVVPIDLAKPILEDLTTLGRPRRAARPWLGLYATAMGNRIAIMGVAEKGPAKSAGLKTGDLVLKVADKEPDGLAGFFRSIWSRGPAGVVVPMTIYRDGRTFDVSLASVDRGALLKRPMMH